MYKLEISNYFVTFSSLLLKLIEWAIATVILIVAIFSDFLNISEDFQLKLFEFLIMHFLKMIAIVSAGEV